LIAFNCFGNGARRISRNLINNTRVSGNRSSFPKQQIGSFFNCFGNGARRISRNLINNTRVSGNRSSFPKQQIGSFFNCFRNGAKRISRNPINNIRKLPTGGNRTPVTKQQTNLFHKFSQGFGKSHLIPETTNQINNIIVSGNRTSFPKQQIIS